MYYVVFSLFPSILFLKEDELVKLMEEKERQKAKAKNQIKSEIPNIDLTIGSVKGNLHSSSSLIDGDGDGESVMVTVSRQDLKEQRRRRWTVSQWTSEEWRVKMNDEEWRLKTESMNPT